MMAHRITVAARGPERRVAEAAALALAAAEAGDQAYDVYTIDSRMSRVSGDWLTDVVVLLVVDQ